MTQLQFNDLEFKEENDSIRVRFYRIYEFFLDKDSLNKIGDFKINKNAVEFPGLSEDRADRKFNALLAQGFANLTNTITNKHTTYIHRFSGIPLSGNGSFGIIDRGTNILELKPSTGCNLDCIFCSVDPTKRTDDFVVEKTYLVEETAKLIEFKRKEKAIDITIQLGTSGESLIYEPLEELIAELKLIEGVKNIGLSTNATLLTEKKADGLIKAGANQIFISLNAIDQDVAEKIAGVPYDAKRIKDLCKDIAKKKIDLVLTPVWVPGFNDDQIEKIITFAKEIHCRLGLQNFLNYKFGKNPVKQIEFEDFYKKLVELEKKHDTKLIYDWSFIEKTKELPKPFRKDETIKAKIMARGTLPDEMIAVAKDRSISVMHCKKDIGKEAKIKIVRIKHNIFVGIES